MNIKLEEDECIIVETPDGQYKVKYTTAQGLLIIHKDHWSDDTPQFEQEFKLEWKEQTKTHLWSEMDSRFDWYRCERCAIISTTRTNDPCYGGDDE